MSDHLDLKLKTLVRELVESSPPPPALPSPAHRRPPSWRRITYAVIASFVIAGLIALVVTRQHSATVSVAASPSVGALAACRARNPRGQQAEQAAPSMVNTLNPYLTNPGLEPHDRVIGHHGLWVDESEVLQRAPRFDVPTGTWTLVKFAWFRTSTDHLSIEGRRLDGPGTFHATHPADASYPIGFIPSDLTFSTGGCWQITATLNTTSVAFFIAFSSSHQALCASLATQLQMLASFPGNQSLVQALRVGYQTRRCP